MPKYVNLAGRSRVGMGTAGWITSVGRLLRIASADHRRYECQGCGEAYELEYYSCPGCGSYRVERTRWMVDG